MAIFRFSKGDSPLDFTGGVPVDQLDRSTWVEKYRDFGTFKIEGKLYTGILDQLPLGSVIGHEGRLELMIVENHEVIESADTDAKVVITGRSLDSITSSRVAGASSSPTSGLLSDYVVNQTGVNYGSELVKELLDNELVNTSASDVVENLRVVNLHNDGTVYSSPKVIERTFLSTPVAELLAQDDLGLRSVRPHQFTSLWEQNPSFPTLFIHKGKDVSTRVGFSYYQGDIEEANYLWSRKSNTSSVFVKSKFCSVLVDHGVVNDLDKSYSIVDAVYLDEQLSEAPTGDALTDIIDQMIMRGHEEVFGNNTTELVEVDISESSMYRYELDYSIGDLVNVHANYGISKKMRVVEYATIFDNNGYSGFPTLSSI